MTHTDGPARPELIVPTEGQRGMTGLHYAAYCNDPDGIRAELQQGSPVDVRDDGGWTPLHWSIDMSQAWGEPEQVVSLLLAAGASPNAVDTSGFSVLLMACGRSSVAIFNQLIEAGADIHVRSATTTPLHEAAGSNFDEAIRALLALGADPSVTDNKGRTPRELAEKCEFEESVRAFSDTQPTAK